MSSASLTLEDVALINVESLPRSAPSSLEFLYIDLGSVVEGVIDWRDVHVTTYANAPSRARRVTQAGDVLFGTVRPGLESHASIPTDATPGQYVASTGFAVIRAKSYAAQGRFLFHYLFSQKIKDEARRAEVGSNYPAVNESDIRRFAFPDIPLGEQRRIAEILDTLDDQIRATKQIIAKLKLAKQGLITDLLVNGVSVKPEGSSEGVLDDFVTWLSGGTPYKGSPQFWSGEIPWVTPKDMKSFLLEQTTDYLTEIGVGAGSRLAPLSAVFIVVRGMILAHTFPVCQTRIASSFNQDIKAVVPGPLLEPRYLAYWFVAQSDSFLRLVGESTHGTKKLDLPDLKVFPIKIPSRDEQLRILRVVDTHERSIDLETAILSKLQIEKEGLMADLLSGRVRVAVETES